MRLKIERKEFYGARLLFERNIWRVTPASPIFRLYHLNICPFFKTGSAIFFKSDELAIKFHDEREWYSAIIKRDLNWLA